MWISRKTLWMYIGEATRKFMAYNLFKSIAALCITALSAYCINHLIFGGLMIFVLLISSSVGIIWLFYTIFMSFHEYLIDIAFKNIDGYEGYIQSIVDVSKLHVNQFQKQYNKYYQVTFNNTTNSRRTDLDFQTGNIKIDPIDGRRFLIKDLIMLKNIEKNDKLEVLYLKHSKVIVSIKAAGEQGSRLVVRDI